MFMLAFHIVAIGLLIVAVWGVAYGQGRRAGERALRRQLELESEGEGAASAEQ